MGQKGKFVSQRAGYSNFWQDIWYSFKSYHSIYFQNNLIRDFIYFLIFIGFSSVNFYNLPCKKINSMIPHASFFINNYHLRCKSLNVSGFFVKKIKFLRGIFLTKFHILKIFNYIIILGNGYKHTTMSRFKFLKAERRLFLFYHTIILLDKYLI